jgi:hypothetical protein
MVEIEFMGRTISLDGEGSPENPFVVRGTGYNPPLAAEIETYIAGRYFEGLPWTVVGTRLEDGADGVQLAILTLRVRPEPDELVQTELWFDVTEALTKV